jgi:putative ABC transport system permease protein
VVNVLDIKVVRDLWAMRTQVLSIALLIAAGIGVFVMSVSNYFALVDAMDAHYRNERFADLFASLKRAPMSLAERIREIDGVGVVEPRVTQAVRVIREDSEIPFSGRIISVPSSDQPLLNRLYLVEGRWIDPARPEEVIINAAYAHARVVRPGDTIDVILNGRLEAFRVVGVALSRVRVRDAICAAASGRSQFRYPLGEPGCGRRRVRHARSLQRSRDDVGARSEQSRYHRGD